MEDIFFKRNAYKKLLLWKKNPNHKPLIVRGLRQTGKTTLVRHFAKENYNSVFFLDFRKDKSIHSIFNGDFDVDKMAFAITVKYPGIKLIPHETVFIFDEIQDCPNARSSLKYFSLDGRYDVISTGSMLGIKNYRITNQESRGISVGFEDYLDLKPLSFEEFVLNVKMDKSLDEMFGEYVKNDAKIPEYVHDEFIQLYRKYACIGGMPEVVKTYISTNDYSEVRRIQKRIISNYEADFGTHLNDKGEVIVDETAKERILATFHSIPRQLAKENQKFQYSVISKKAKVREYETSIEWLEDYGLISRCINLSKIDEPLEYFSDGESFKIFMNDPGLYLALVNDNNMINAILYDTLGISKGGLYENLISCSFNNAGLSQFYYHKPSGLEIDFVSMIKDKLSLIEVKAKGGKTKSADTILNSSDVKGIQLIKFSAGNIGNNGNKFNYPYYLSDLILSGE